MKHCRPDNQNNTPYVSSSGSRDSASRSSGGGRRFRDEQPTGVRRQPERVTSGDGYSARPQSTARDQYSSQSQNTARNQRSAQAQNTARNRYPTRPQNVYGAQYSSAPKRNAETQYTDISQYSANTRYNAGTQNKRKPQKKKAGPVAIGLRIFFIILLLFAGFMAVKTIMTYHKEDKAFDNLAAIVDTPKDTEDGVSKYQQLYDLNHDFFGWIKIEDTDINYPVMYSPDEPERYLHMDFYGNYSESGVLFIDGECVPGGGHYIIYGHHMFNGSMFGNLPKYEKQDYYEDHKLIQFDTLTEEGTYEIFAALYSKDYDKNDTGVFKYYNYKTLNSEIVFNEFVYNAKQESIYDTGITPKFGEEILTLSTCNYHTEDGRFVVVAHKIK